MRPKIYPPDESTRSGEHAKQPVVLTIAGYDPSSGAGITADLQVFAAHGLFGISAITAMTVQSTQGVAAVHCTDSGWLSQTLECLAADLPIAGVKIGMLGSDESIQAIARFLGPPSHRPAKIPIVFDPVLKSSSGYDLLATGALKRVQIELLPRVTWITPNWRELEVLSGERIKHIDQVPGAAQRLGKRYPSLHIVATGGEAREAVDLLWSPGGSVHAYHESRVETTSTHGTGCAFSSALLSRLVLGDQPTDAVSRAKGFVTTALRLAPGLGQGNGPLNLLWPLTERQSRVRS